MKTEYEEKIHKVDTQYQNRMWKMAAAFFLAMFIVEYCGAQPDTLTGTLSGVYENSGGFYVYDAYGAGNPTYPVRFFGELTIDSGTESTFNWLEVYPYGTLWTCDSSLIPSGPNLVDSFILDAEWNGITLYWQFAADSLDYFGDAFITYLRAYHNWYDLHDCPIDTIHVTEVAFSPPGGTDRPVGGTKEIRFTIRIESGGRVNLQNHYWRRVPDSYGT